MPKGGAYSAWGILRVNLSCFQKGLTKMKRIQTLAAALVAGSLCLTASAQDVGTSMLDQVELEGFAKTKAETFNEFAGRTVLIEFFAYW